MKNKSHPKVTFKWSSVDQVLLPALSGVVKTCFDTAKICIIFQFSKENRKFLMFSIIKRPKRASFQEEFLSEILRLETIEVDYLTSSLVYVRYQSLDISHWRTSRIPRICKGLAGA